MFEKQQKVLIEYLLQKNLDKTISFTQNSRLPTPQHSSATTPINTQKVINVGTLPS